MPFILAAVGAFVGPKLMCGGTTSSGTHWTQMSLLTAGGQGTIAWQNLQTGQQITLPVGQSPPDNPMTLCAEIGGPHDMIHNPSWAAVVFGGVGFFVGKLMEN